MLFLHSAHSTIDSAELTDICWIIPSKWMVMLIEGWDSFNALQMSGILREFEEIWLEANNGFICFYKEETNHHMLFVIDLPDANSLGVSTLASNLSYTDDNPKLRLIPDLWEYLQDLN